MKIIIALFILLLSQLTLAHTQSVAKIQLFVNEQESQLEWQVALIDLNKVIALDLNADGAITQSEFQASLTAIKKLTQESVSLSNKEDTCALDIKDIDLNSRAQTVFAVIKASTDCSQINELHYHFLKDIDSLHLALTKVFINDTENTHVLSAKEPTIPLQNASNASTSFIYQGIIHILIGADHLLFLMTLLLPLFLTRSHAKIKTIASYTITFTIAHSITLLITALNWISLPSHLVEACIAATVAIGAWFSVRPQSRPVPLALIFAIGLIHGMGFASVFGELISGQALISQVLFFNLGVELGQLGFVACAGAILWLASQLKARVVLLALAYAILIIATLWTVERLLQQSWMPF